MRILIIFMTILMMTIMIDRWVRRPRLKQIMINNDDFDDLDDDNDYFDNFDDEFLDMQVSRLRLRLRIIMLMPRTGY